jgi:uncharacterized membrane protein YkoI
MQKTLAAVLAAFVLTIGASSLSAQGAKVTVKEEKPGLLKRAKVTPDAATATAQAMLPNAKLQSAEIEEENGKLQFSFDFKTAGKSGIDEVNVDALTGKVIGGVEHESPATEKKEAAAEKASKKP